TYKLACSAGGVGRAPDWAGVPRQLVAIIYDTGPSTYRLCWITLSAGRKGVKKRVLHNIAPKKSSRKNSSYVSFIIQAELQLP
ncbi:hypothetical protein DRB41_01730, partial [Salmonella enterica]|nr:hypothetical protein [Salmonella enterica]